MLRYEAALALTLAVEVPLYVAALRWGWGRRRPGGAWLAAIGVNVVTHPVLWFVLAPNLGLLVSEALVCVAEGLMLMAWLRRRDPLLLVLSVAANATSVLAGLVLTAAF